MRRRYKRSHYRRRAADSEFQREIQSVKLPDFVESLELQEQQKILRLLEAKSLNLGNQDRWLGNALTTSLCLYIVYLLVGNAPRGVSAGAILGLVIIIPIFWLYCWLPAEIITRLLSLLTGHSARSRRADAKVRDQRTRVESLLNIEREKWEAKQSHLRKIAEIEATAKREALRKKDLQLDTLDPFEFEQMIAEYFRTKGLSPELTRRTGDAGVDVWLKQGSKKIAVQCKRYGKNNPISRPDVQKFIGAIITEGAHEGIFITTSSFTDGAKKAALAGATPIRLVEREEVFKMLGLASGAA